MKIEVIKSKPVVVGDKLIPLLDETITDLSDKSVLAISSKIVSICEGSVVKVGEVEKQQLVKEQAEYYLPPDNKYHFSLSIKYNILIASAGIDESNGNGYYILWPKNPYRSSNIIRTHLKKRFDLTNLGVIITDSKTTPLRWGVTGVSVAHSGFNPLNDYIGKPDIFNRPFKVEKANIADSLAAAAVVVMGEGNEQTPIAKITDIPFVQFQNRNPTQKEINDLSISIDDDLYSELLKGVRWRKGGNK